jgi:hypothetical protein
MDGGDASTGFALRGEQSVRATRTDAIGKLQSSPSRPNTLVTDRPAVLTASSFSRVSILHLLHRAAPCSYSYSEDLPCLHCAAHHVTGFSSAFLPDLQWDDSAWLELGISGMGRVDPVSFLRDLHKNDPF